MRSFSSPKEVLPYLSGAIKLIPGAEKKKSGYFIYVTKQSISVVPHNTGSKKNNQNPPA